MIITTTDFIGEYQVPATRYSNLDLYINKYSKLYLERLFGVELYKLFDADLVDGVPVLDRFVVLFNALSFDKDGCVYQSEGIKQMLVEFIYYHFTVESQLYNTSTGTMSTDSELSKPKPYANNIISAYNKAVSNSRVIQYYILENEDDYTEENIQEISYIDGI